MTTTLNPTSRAAPIAAPRHRTRSTRRLNLTLLSGATAMGLWLGVAAPATSPVAAPPPAVVAVNPVPIQPPGGDFRGGGR